MPRHPFAERTPKVEQTAYALAAPQPRHSRAGLLAREAAERLAPEARRTAMSRVQRFFLARGVHNASSLTVDGLPRSFSWPESINARPGDFLCTEYLAQDIRLLTELDIPANGVICDIGANIGGKSFAYALWTQGGGQVFSFEPFGATYEFLRRNMEDNGFTHVATFNLGLSDSQGELYIGQPAPHQHQRYGGPLIEAGLFSVHAAHPDETGALAGETRPFTTLDAFAEEHGLAALDFVKIDVEGHEWQVLNGGLDTLRRFGPAVQMEMNAFALGLAAVDPRQIVELLRRLGYALFVEDNGALLPYEDAVLTDGRYGQGDLIPYMFELIARKG